MYHTPVHVSHIESLKHRNERINVGYSYEHLETVPVYCLSTILQLTQWQAAF
jgi:hypothetical protein